MAKIVIVFDMHAKFKSEFIDNSFPHLLGARVRTYVYRDICTNDVDNIFFMQEISL